MGLPRQNSDDDLSQLTADASSSQPRRISREPVVESSATVGSSSPGRRNHDIPQPETMHQLASNPNEHLIQEHIVSSSAQERQVKWGISWKTPFLMILWLLVGISWALGHHFHYQSLDRTEVGSSSRQNWAVRFGTAFAFLVITSLRAACDTAYKQYIWTLFKRKPFSLSVLDKLFSITSDPTALLSWSILRHAKTAFLIAAICWCMALAGITPPATLSVVLGFENETKPLSWSSLNWRSSKFFDREASIAQPSSEVLRIATLAAESMAIIPPTPPAANSSFHVHFFGPSVQCSLASSAQQANFDYYTVALANGSLMTVTEPLFASGKLKWDPDNFPGNTQPLMNVYSAFSPYAGRLGWLAVDSPVNYSPDEFNNWVMDLPPDTINAQSNQTLPGWDWDGPVSAGASDAGFVTQQLWIQTADQSILCTMGNASFDVDYEFVNGALTVAEYSISMFEPFWMPFQGSSVTYLLPTKTSENLTLDDSINPFNTHAAMYLAFSGLLNRNVSTTLTSSMIEGGRAGNHFDGTVTIYDGSSKILQHRLSACDEIVYSYWNGNNAIGIGQDGPVFWEEAAASTYAVGFNSTLNAPASNPPNGYAPSSDRFTGISNNLFTKPSWMCRNRTLLRAVEDLANNITISMLSSANLVTQNATTINVLYFPTINIYTYDSRNLIISYGIAVLCTILCVCVGFFALHYNGVAHSTAFSAIVATTRNHELDKVSRGHSLGALPLEHTSMRVRFGEIMREGEKTWDNTDDVSSTGRHIGFGAAENIVSLRKGGKYM